MPRSIRILGLLIVLTLWGSGVVVPKMGAQENTSQTAKRKVRSSVTPVYPELARQMHVKGKVKIEATISPDGRVTSTHVVGGSPLLVGSAVDAMKKWRYETGSKESIEIVEFDFSG
jgi:TonB family protein